MNKTCSKCGEEKALELFRKQKLNKSGYAADCKACHSKYMTAYYANNPEKNAEKVRMNTYYKPNWHRHKITEEKYKELLAIHSGLCHACKESIATNIDHDHECCSGNFSCGKCVRGVLCHHCNTALGLLKDSQQNIKGLLSYIS